MPKNWLFHKAEIRQLYIDEGKTLEQVRGILKARHGFTASIRAYRMRVDEWAFRKYKTKDLALCESTPMEGASLPSIPEKINSVEPSSSVLGTDPDFRANEQVPLESTTDSEVLSFTNDPPADCGRIEALLYEWQASGSRLKALATILQSAQPQNVICTVDRKPLLFQLIEENVEPQERHKVGVTILRYDMSVCQTADYPDAQWLAAWHSACTACNWDDARDSLYENDFIARTAGAMFLDCARIVIAEHFLRMIMEQLNSFEAHGTSSASSHSEEEVDYKQNYLDILAEFPHSEHNLDSSFYKLAVELIEDGSEPTTDGRSPLRSDLADEYRRKYLESECLEGGAEDCGDRQNRLHREGSRESRTYDKSLTPGTLDNRVSPVGGATPVHFHLKPEALTISETLLSKWRSLRGFRRYTHDLLVADGSDISIFELSPTDMNLFDILLHEVPESEVMLLTKAILGAFSSINLDLCYRPLTLAWWISLYTSRSWSGFLAELERETIDAYLGVIMSSAAVRLVINATVLLVGERFLVSLNAQIARHPSRDDTVNYMPNHELSQQYMTILKEFQARKLGVDLRWRSLALNH